MSKHILVFGAGRSATVLIHYLKKLVKDKRWRLTVSDSNLPLAESKAGNSPGITAVQLDIRNDEQRDSLISSSDLVISMMPPALHLPIAIDCCRHQKHLLTASYVSEDIRALSAEIEGQDILFLCEMGLDPGIDHMSAMQIIEQLRNENATIHSFRSHCGGLVAPESDNNPWHYKISWNSMNVVRAGATGAVFKKDNREMFVRYENLFRGAEQVNIAGVGNYAFYPNRDSLHYVSLYGLEESAEFMRTTLRHPAFCSGWSAIVDAGLTSEAQLDGRERSFKNWSSAITPFITEENYQAFQFLGLFNDEMVPSGLNSSASILQFLLEQKLMLKASDKDMIIMLHEFDYTVKNINKSLKSLLVVKGEDGLHTAMAKTVGLPLGIAARLVLEDSIKLRGLHLPIHKLIYEPVLQELKSEGIAFTEEIQVVE